MQYATMIHAKNMYHTCKQYVIYIKSKCAIHSICMYATCKLYVTYMHSY